MPAQGSSNPVTPIRQGNGSGSVQVSPAQRGGQKGTPRAPGHLAGVSGTPAQGRQSSFPSPLIALTRAGRDGS